MNIISQENTLALKIMGNKKYLNKVNSEKCEH